MEPHKKVRTKFQCQALNVLSELTFEHSECLIHFSLNFKTKTLEQIYVDDQELIQGVTCTSMVRREATEASWDFISSNH